MMVRRNVHLFVGSLAVTVSIWKLFPGRFFECTRTWGSMSIAALCHCRWVRSGRQFMFSRTDRSWGMHLSYHLTLPSSFPFIFTWVLNLMSACVSLVIWSHSSESDDWVRNGGWQCKVQSFTALQTCSCSLTPAMSFHLVLMSYHEKAQGGQSPKLLVR